MFIADLHIHSRYSRATSRDLTPEMLDFWGQRKGLQVIGTGDFTHPAWREELKEKLEPAEEGLYRLREPYKLTEGLPAARRDTDPSPRFIVTGEISSIYKKKDKVRKIHNVLLFPSLEAAEAYAKRLEMLGNLHSDGRPILGLDSRILLEMLLEICPDAMLIPAHIWTPHFSLFGAYSGFDRIEDCYEDLTPYIHAVETGLSSDPPMNWRLSALDRYTLVSNSDAHSPANLAREANLFDTELSYPAMKHALEHKGSGEFQGTIEFFPEEGKYHWDGHRNCGVCLKPSDTIKAGGKCPVCGGRITVGVSHRVEELADRPEDYRPENPPHYESLVPLREVIAASTGYTPASARVGRQYDTLLQLLGPELYILREAPLDTVEKEAGPLIAEGIRRLRQGTVEVSPGFDGEYGRVKILNQSDIDRLSGQLRFFNDTFAPKKKAKSLPLPTPETAEELTPAAPKTGGGLYGLNPEQEAAVQAGEPVVTVVAGPGTGKTRTLVYRIAYLVEHLGVDPSRITAVTFTNKAAAEMRQRLAEHFGDKRLVRAMTIGTFHSICLQLLKKWRGEVTLLDENAALSIAEDVAREQNWEGSPRDLLRALSRKKNGLPDPSETPSALLDAFVRQQNRFGALDFDDLLLEVLRQFEEYRRTRRENPDAFTHLLVDEFQDINDVQYRLIREWSRNSDALFVIGDPDQSIYGFRGSDAHCFERLAADHPEARSIRLVKNYRSTPEILGCALPLINAAAYGGQRRLEPCRESGTAVGLFPAADPFSEALYIVKEINRLVGGVDMLDSETVASRHKKRHDKARGFSDIAVLYRTHRQAELLEQCLIKEGIPYTVSGREDYLAETPVRTALSFFRLLLHPGDIFSLKTCLRTGGYFTPEDAARLAEEYAAGNMTLPRLTALSGDYPPAEDMALLPAFSEQLKTYGPLAKKGKPEELLASWARDNSLTGIDSMDRLLSAAALHPAMEDLLQTVALGAEADLSRRSERAVKGDAVSLLTLHGSKGLEFPVVFLCGAQKGKIPYEAPGRDADPEEERRLFYVGLTRAQEELTVLYAGEGSPFLRDIPAALLEKRSDGRAPYGGKQLSLFDGL